MPSGLYADTTLRNLLGLDVGDALIPSGGGSDLPDYTTEDDGKVLGVIVDDSGEESVAELSWVKGVPQPADGDENNPSINSGNMLVVDDNGNYQLEIVEVLPVSGYVNRGKVLGVSNNLPYNYEFKTFPDAPSSSNNHKMVVSLGNRFGYQKIPTFCELSGSVESVNGNLTYTMDEPSEFFTEQIDQFDDTFYAFRLRLEVENGTDDDPQFYNYVSMSYQWFTIANDNTNDYSKYLTIVFNGYNGETLECRLVYNWQEFTWIDYSITELNSV